MQKRDCGWFVLILFFCSGATALVYEVIWSKFLSEMFGSTIYAQTVVLAAFMGGLALGNKIFGRWADKVQKPVHVYGYLEVIIGIYAFFFPTLDVLADHIFVSIGGRIAQHSLLLLALKGGLSFALLLGPTFLMGGTLPLLAAWLQHFTADAGRRSARFYSVNSLGAVAGAALAGFCLVQNLGMVASLKLTAMVNLLIGATAIMISSRFQRQPSATQAAPASELEVARPDTLRWAGLTVGLTGAVAMGLEVLASRSLAMIFGSSLQSFAIVLMAFILGIGLGSAWISSPRRRGQASEKILVLLLCAAAGWLTLLVFNIEHWVDLYRIARTGLARTSVGYIFHEWLSAGIALVIFGLPAACIGSVLPLMIRALSQKSAALGASVGSLLTWNTLGAVVGTLLTGFVLMPWAGVHNSFGVLALALSLAAIIHAWRCRWRIGLAVSAGAIVFAAGLFVLGGEDWRYVISSGAFRSRELEFNAQLMSQRKQHTKILFYEDGPDATVSVEEETLPNFHPVRGLKVNGKADASSSGDLSTQFLLAHLPMIARPGAKDVFIFGLGSGITAGALLDYPVDRITLAENCEPVIHASQFFTNWNRNVLQDPRVHLWREDARTVLKLDPQKYDVIIAEPSNPWTVGIGSVFSGEFYQIASSRLKPGGVMAQWFHVYEMNNGIVELVLRTFDSVFPFVEIWDTSTGDIVMLGSMQPWPSNAEVFKQSFVLPGVRSDLARIGILSPEALWARQLASQRTAFAIVGDGTIQSDLFPVLEYSAPRAFYIGNSATLLDDYDERTRQMQLAPADKLTALQSLSRSEVSSVFLSFLTVNHKLWDSLNGKAEVPYVFGTKGPPANGEGPDESDMTLSRAIASLNSGDLNQASQLATLALQQNPTNALADYVIRIIGREQQFPTSDHQQ
jgi:predicted membrane-bound spermidine synthase